MGFDLSATSTAGKATRHALNSKTGPIILGIKHTQQLRFRTLGPLVLTFPLLLLYNLLKMCFLILQYVLFYLFFIYPRLLWSKIKRLVNVFDNWSGRPLRFFRQNWPLRRKNYVIWKAIITRNFRLNSRITLIFGPILSSALTAQNGLLPITTMILSLLPFGPESPTTLLGTLEIIIEVSQLLFKRICAPIIKRFNLWCLRRLLGSLRVLWRFSAHMGCPSKPRGLMRSINRIIF